MGYQGSHRLTYRSDPAPTLAVRLPDYRHRAASVVDALLADRPEQQFAEAAAAAGADYQQIGVR